MADFSVVEQQHRNINMISLAQSGVGINIDFTPIEIKFVFVHVQGVAHVITQMTAFSDNQSKGLHRPQGFVRQACNRSANRAHRVT